MATISNFEFVVGTEDGKVLLCSVLQARNVAGKDNFNQTLTLLSNKYLVTCVLFWSADSKQIFDPIVMELEAQIYEISSLIVKNHGNQVVVISCDISGVVFLRYMQKVRYKINVIITKSLT